MSKNVIIEKRVRKNVWILEAQDIEIRRICKKTGLTITDAVSEALRYWINEQHKMGV